jgi:glycerol kinase
MKYILSIDQSTSLTKAMLFSPDGALLYRADVPHHQYVNEKGWVEHDVEEIYRNVLEAVAKVIKHTGVDSSSILCAALTNQRETVVAFDAADGRPLYHAIVWQCGRAQEICRRLASRSREIKEKTGLNLSPYFSAAKMNWILEHVDIGCPKENIRLGTVDSFLIYRLSKGTAFKTDYSNVCRTQLFNIDTLAWDPDILGWFGIEKYMLPEVCDSDALFCMTDFDGILPSPIPLHSVMGDSQSALFAQRCLHPGTVKATYGNGSSIMMNTGGTRLKSEDLVASIAWKFGNKLDYVLEGNINFSGATTKWLVENLKLLPDAKQAGILAQKARKDSNVYLVPAFTGFGAPYWNSDVRAVISGIDLSTGVNEIVRAGEEAIAYQINDVIRLLAGAWENDIKCLRVDGGPTHDTFLMQFQADISDLSIDIAPIEELSAQGVALAAGRAEGVTDQSVVDSYHCQASLHPQMHADERERKLSGWSKAIEQLMKK